MSEFSGIVADCQQTVLAGRWHHLAGAVAGTGPERLHDWQSAGVLLVHRQQRDTPEDLLERQPLRGGRSVLMVDGRLDNRDDLAAALGLQGAGLADSKLILAALERWGDDAVSRLVGPLALAWWDDAARRLLLARDALGHRALYYADLPDGLAFATTPRALLALPEVPREVDETHLATVLIDLPPPPDATFFTGIRQVPAAHLAVWRPGRLDLRRYWDIDDTRRISFRRDEDYVEAAREHLTTAVRCRLRSNRPVAAHLTGGLDSTAVATTAARLLAPARLVTLTTVPATGLALPDRPNRFADESGYVRQTAALYPNMAPYLVSGSAVHHQETHPAGLFLATGQPIRNIMNVGWMAPMNEKARDIGIGTVLAGGCGNLTLSWDGVAGLRDMARAGRLARLWHEIPRLAKTRNLSSMRLAWAEVLRPLLPIAAPRLLDRLRGRSATPWLDRSAIHPAFAASLGLGDTAQEVRGALAGSGERQARLRLLRVHQASLHLRSGLRAVHGLDIRDPLADRRLVEFCFALPNDQYLRHGVTRWLARRVLAGQAPPAVVDNPRRGIQIPDFMHRVIPRREEFLATIESLETSPLASRCLDLPRLKSLAANMPADNAAEHLMSYLAVLDRGLHVGQFIRWVEGGNG